MINMPGKSRITIIQKLGESLAAEVFLAKDESREESVVVKKIRPEFAQEGIFEHIEQQRVYLLELNIRQLIVPDLQIDNDGSLLLISPCCNGRIFSEWLEEHKKIDTVKLLEIGIALADGLAVRHGAALIHKGVKPANILIQDNPIRIQLIDEIKVSDNSWFSRFVSDNQYRRGTLPYLAPEQTGRIRLDAGYYSDLYALGAILYECATGRPLFLSDDPLDIIYSHLAEVPVPVSDLNQDCPGIVSDIIIILLEKAPERRYQSSKGLCSDLQTCLTSWKKSERATSSALIPPFILKQKDQSNQITIPSIMVGRDQEKARLLAEYKRVCTGKLGIASISGLSGMGKTRLVQELELPIVAQRGYYTFGKFNQYNQHLPYSTLIGAVGRLIRQFLTEDAGRVAHWRKQILDATGENGGLLVGLGPELEHLIGKQPRVAPLPPAEARNRFNNLFCRFLASLACAEHPLVLFIDDMQWCDHATYDLLDLIFSRPQDFPYLFIIGAHRNNEVDEDHRIIQMENAIQASSQPLLKIYIDSLGQDSVNEMIAFILNTSRSRTQKLTDIIYPVSAGNPLFVNESLRWLHNNNRLFLSDKGVWTWASDALAGLQLPVSAKALFYDKLSQFPDNVTRLLSTGALLGSHFEAIDLALVAQISLQKLYTSLGGVLSQRILLQDKTTLSFFHDQIQAGAADFLDDEQKRRCHRKIARVFIDQLQKEENQKENTGVSAPRLFSLVEHLNAGHRDDAGEAELYEEAQFNFRAGVAAMETLALDACDHYFSRSAALCSENMWQTDYDFMFILYKKLARAALVNGDQKRSSKTVELALLHAQTDLDRAECLYEQTVAHASMGDVRRCIDLGRRALVLIGETLPLAKDEIEGELSHLVNEFHQNNRDIWHEVVNAPFINGRKGTLELHLYGETLAACYLSGQIPMFTLLALRTIKMAVNEGVDDFTCFGLTIMAFYFQRQNKYHLANCYEDAMLKMVERFPESFGSVRAMTAAAWLTFHSRCSVSGLLTLCRQAMESCIKCGELQYTGLANCPLLWFDFVQGKNLHQLKKQIESLVSFSQKFNLAIPLGVGEALQITLSPLWESGSTRLNKPHVAARLSLWSKEEHAVSLGCYFVFKGVAAYYNGQYLKAEQSLDKGKIYLNGITNTIVYRLWYVFRYLAALQTGNKNGTEDYLEKVTNWAAHGPILKPYLALMQAEALFFKGEFQDVRNAYLDAIDIAHKEEYLFLEAFLNERLSQYLEKENHFSSKIYFNTAILLYQDCGASNKTAQLNNQAHLNRSFFGKALLEKEQITTESGFEQKTDIDTVLDHNFLLNSVKAITGELDFNKLLKIIMGSVMARLGAKTGYLLIVEKGNLIPSVSGSKQENVVVKFKDDAEFSTSKLSMGIVRYVFRTKKMLLLKDAKTKGNFIADEVVQRENLRSVLCIPVIKQSQALGVLYLENSLIESVFSDDQIELTELLTAQAAIALQNAVLLKDITIEQICAAEKRWEFALEGAQYGVWDWDIQTGKVFFSPRWKEILGYKEDEVGDTLDEWNNRIHPDDKTESNADLSRHFSGETPYYKNECRVLCRDGTYKWILNRGKVMLWSKNHKPLRMTGTCQDIDEQKLSEEMIWKQANFDTLTGLPNRRMFYNRLEQEIIRADRDKYSLALFLLDLDRFKDVNDTLGHDAGDLLLQEVGRRISDCLRNSDTVARLGGDEFAIILPEINDSTNIEDLAQKLINKIEEKYLLSDKNIHISCSIGITLYPGDARDIETLIKNADQAMYVAKKDDAHSFSYFTQSLQDAAKNRLRLTNDLCNALADKQFEVYFQSIIDLKTDRIIKAEALLRWHHPTRGMVSPMEFICLAEEAGLINKIGAWVLKESAQRASQWSKAFENNFQISINVSPVQFKMDTHLFILEWQTFLHELDISGEKIIIEISEELLLNAETEVFDKFLWLRDAGIQVAIDDFGAGHSALSSLRKIDIDYLKIDKRFVNNLECNKNDLILCKAIILMAHTLGLKVIAEGVETEGQKKILVDAGCDFAQGYLFSRPVPFYELERALNYHGM